VDFKILVVDDDALLCEALLRMIRAEGYEAHCAHTALEAADLVTKHKFHLAIIDWELRGGVMSGVQLGQRFRSQGMATFMWSGYSVAYIRSQWRDPLEGFLQFFQKPITTEDEKHNFFDKIRRVEKSFEGTEP